MKLDVATIECIVAPQSCASTERQVLWDTFSRLVVKADWNSPLSLAALSGDGVDVSLEMLLRHLADGCSICADKLTSICLTADSPNLIMASWLVLNQMIENLGSACNGKLSPTIAALAISGNMAKASRHVLTCDSCRVSCRSVLNMQKDADCSLIRPLNHPGFEKLLATLAANRVN